MLFIAGILAMQFVVVGGERDTSSLFFERRFSNAAFARGGPFVAEGVASAVSVAQIIVERNDREVFFAVNDAAFLGSSPPLSNLIPTRDGLMKYRVKAGDTLSGIAARFGITLETLRAANPSLKSSLSVGQELVILPVSGFLYELKEGDTLEELAGRYQVKPELIKQYNADYQKLFAEGTGSLILPYAKPTGSGRYGGYALTGLPDVKNYFVLPASGWNWGELHDYNAVDIANQCGTHVYAAAEGLVVNDEKLGDGLSGWNNGYGLFVLIEHPNGTKTRYAHLGKIFVRVGDYVSHGDPIGVMGNTGNTHGPTGCHLHFEVYGAKNPFAVR